MERTIIQFVHHEPVVSTNGSSTISLAGTVLGVTKVAFWFFISSGNKIQLLVIFLMLKFLVFFYCNGYNIDLQISFVCRN